MAQLNQPHLEFVQWSPRCARASWTSAGQLNEQNFVLHLICKHKFIFLSWSSESTRDTHTKGVQQRNKTSACNNELHQMNSLTSNCECVCQLSVVSCQSCLRPDWAGPLGEAGAQMKNASESTSTHCPQI